ncbi:MAG: GGDEF domain-containing response regulator [Desulfovibrionaceae bacterium]
MDARVSPCFFPRTQRIFVVTDDDSLIELLNGLWWPGCMEFLHFHRASEALDLLFENPPDMLVADQRLPDMTGAQLANLVKAENVYRQLPVILCLDQEDMQYPWDWNEVEVDDFLFRPFLSAEARDRINLALLRALRALDANPLSKLPGNTSIIQRTQDLVDRKENFALGYVDLDHFKSFNDKYGFSRGDEILMMTARLIVNTVRDVVRNKQELSFVGHVGGDDFVFIVAADRAEQVCKRIVTAFDAIVRGFYDQDDRKAGGIRSTDRQGIMREFPFMAVSIAVVLNTDGKIRHAGEVAASAAGLKKKAKEQPGSSYVIDRRRA